MRTVVCQSISSIKILTLIFVLNEEFTSIIHKHARFPDVGQKTRKCKHWGMARFARMKGHALFSSGNNNEIAKIH